MCVFRNLLEVHMYLHEYTKVKSSTVTTGMMWAWPIWLKSIQLWRNVLGAMGLKHSITCAI